MFGRIASYFQGTTYQARAFRGTALTLFNFGAANILRLASNLILTRLLFPEAFGLMALVQVVVTGVAMFSDIGLRGAIVQDPRGNDPAFLNTAWTLQAGRGVLLFLVMVALAGPMSEFYDEPLLADILPVVAITALLQGLNSTRLASASRELYIGRLVVLGLVTQLLGVAATIALAWWLQSVWALAFGTLVAPALLMILSHFAVPGIRNWFALERAATGRLISFGKYVFLATLAGFFINQGDRAVLGKFVSLSDIAIYTIAFFLASVPVLLAEAMSARIIFPLYARRPPSESERNRRKLARARRLLTLALICLSCLIAILGDPMVRLLYDPRYHAAGAFVTLIGLANLPKLIVFSYIRLPLAAGHSGRFATLMIVSALIQLAILVWAASQYGLVGVALTPIAATVLAYPLLVWIIRPYRGWDMMHDIGYAALSLLLAAGVVAATADVLAPYF